MPTDPRDAVRQLLQLAHSTTFDGERDTALRKAELLSRKHGIAWPPRDKTPPRYQPAYRPNPSRATQRDDTQPAYSTCPECGGRIRHRCRQCGHVINPNRHRHGEGRPREYCSQACRQAAYRARNA